MSSVCYVDPSKPASHHPSFSGPVWTEPRCYGNTETFTISSGFPANTPSAMVAESCGEPLPGNTIKIVDPDTGKAIPRGQQGEIAVKGPTLMMGYVGVPLAETLDEEGFFRTGDSGRIDEKGRVHFAGRLSDIIKTGGANVAPAEVDAVLCEYPGVKIAKTVGIAHDTLGEMVVACIVPRENIELDENSIREFLKGRIASYKVPRRVYFVLEDEIAQTGSAKIKATALRELVANRLKAEAENSCDS